MAAAAPDATVDLFAISPGRGDGDELAHKLPLLAEGGLRRFLLREKELSPERRGALARRLAPLCRELGVELWIAEDAALARSVAATGVHLSERSPAPSTIARESGATLALGVSLHEVPTASRAAPPLSPASPRSASCPSMRSGASARTTCPCSRGAE
jgi:thiamine monophosphate synthase